MTALPKPLPAAGNVIAVTFGAGRDPEAADQARCLGALRTMQAALTDQARAVTRLQLAVETLRAELLEIGMGLHRFRSRLGEAGQGVNELSQHMRDLAATAGRGQG